MCANACIYLRKICYVYILNIFIYNIKYKNIDIKMYIHVNIFKIYSVCVYLYIKEHLNKLECREKFIFFL